MIEFKACSIDFVKCESCSFRLFICVIVAFSSFVIIELLTMPDLFIDPAVKNSFFNNFWKIITSMSLLILLDKNFNPVLFGPHYLPHHFSNNFLKFNFYIH